MNNLISKYNVSAPRYTSYPTVPYWDKKVPSNHDWLNTVNQSLGNSNKNDGISIYIHLPFCESLCTYCACNTRITTNHNVEEPYIDSLLKEWAIYLKTFEGKPRIREIHLGGGTPTFFTSGNLWKLIKGILSNSTIDENAEFSFEAHPNSTTPQHLLTLFSLGFRRVSFGIQDFDFKVQNIINRVQSFDQVNDIVKVARNIGYTSINFDLIYGLPLQTLQSVKSTIHKVNLIRPDRIAFYSYAHVPWMKPGQRKFTEADLPKDIVKRKLYETGRNLFLESGYEEIGMDHFSLKSDSLFMASQNGKLHRNFMGYTHNYTQLMIGLGVSSISDSWFGYSQNVKKVEDYRRIVDTGLLPVLKGHILNEEDLILRKHIQNIMCHSETSWFLPHEQSRDMENILSRLMEFEKDELIIIEPFKLKVTKSGKAFLRNICMAFDSRMWKALPQSEIFSTST